MHIRHMMAAAALALQLPCAQVQAQTAPAPEAGPFARMVVIQPLPGQDAAFRSGYQRHLEWHRGAGDRWTWYGWDFVLGERLGKFMDGTFMHAASDFDHAVQPAADSADNVKNVEPYAEFQTHGIYERLSDLSACAPLPDASPFLSMTTYFVAPGRAADFEAAVRARSRGRAASERFSWYRLTVGGEAPAYVLMRAVPSFGAATQVQDWFGAARRSERPGVVTRVRSELLKFDPKMSHQPEA